MSTNTNDYSVGMARIYWTNPGTVATQVDSVIGAIALGAANAYDLGNVTAAEIGLDVTYLEHFISYAGDRRKDKTAAITKVINIPVTFDQINATTLTHFFSASPISSSRHIVLAKDTQPPVGCGVLVFYTDTGKDFYYAIPKGSIKAEGALSFNAEDWMNIPMSIEVLHHSTYNARSSATPAPFGFIDLTATSNPAPGV